MTDQDVQSKEEGLYSALRQVVDPEIGMNVVELGLVRSVEIADESAHVVMIMTTPFCPYAPQLLEQTRRTDHHRDGSRNVGPQHDGRRSCR